MFDSLSHKAMDRRPYVKATHFLCTFSFPSSTLSRECSTCVCLWRVSLDPRGVRSVLYRDVSSHCFARFGAVQWLAALPGFAWPRVMTDFNLCFLGIDHHGNAAPSAVCLFRVAVSFL